MHIVCESEGGEPADTSQAAVNGRVFHAGSDGDQSLDGVVVGQSRTIVGDGEAGIDGINVDLHAAAMATRRDRVGSILQILTIEYERIVVQSCGNQAKDVASYDGFTEHAQSQR
ncbi:MAG: hypothetical protein OXK82_11985 [Deltaproteobacteria bacterium]|nr:hypothetical protein [Deltaproteobacteria bacterium]